MLLITWQIRTNGDFDLSCITRESKHVSC